MTVLLDALGHEIRRLTLDHAVYVPRIARVPFIASGSDELAAAAAEAALDADVVVLAHHSCSAMGESVEVAWRRALNLEQAAELTFRALQLGDRDTTFPVDARDAIRHG